MAVIEFLYMFAIISTQSDAEKNNFMNDRDGRRLLIGIEHADWKILSKSQLHGGWERNSFSEHAVTIRKCDVQTFIYILACIEAASKRSSHGGRKDV